MAGAGLDIEFQPDGGAAPLIFARERRLHAQAHDCWRALRLQGNLPLLSDLSIAAVAPFAANSILVEIGALGQRIAFLGEALRGETGMMQDKPLAEDVAPRSVLTALLRRIPEVAAARSPLGFEASIGDSANGPTLYRGILLPFADREGAVSAVHCVVSWQRLAVVAGQADIAAAVACALSLRPADPAPSPWAPPRTEALPPATMAQRLASARTWAALTVSARGQGLTPMHRALSSAYDLLLAGRAEPAAFADLGEQGAAASSHCVVDLVFGSVPSPRLKDRLAAALDHGLRLGIGSGLFGALANRHPRGFIGLAAAERLVRRSARLPVGMEVVPQPVTVALSPLGTEVSIAFGHRGERPADVPPPIRLAG